MKPPALSPAQSDRLGTLESTIQKGLTSFVEVGNALLAIRDEELYRLDYSTFEEYCRGRWGLSIRHSKRLMSAAETSREIETHLVNKVVNKTGPMGHTPLPESERVARPLSALPIKERPVAWEEAVAIAPNGKPTAKIVESVVSATVGRIKLNGVEQSDTEEVAKLRLSGKIRPETIVEITEPEPDSAAPEPEPEPEPELDDEAWLETLPVRPRLSADARTRFDRDALLFRRTIGDRKTLARAIAPLLKSFKHRDMPPFAFRLRLFTLLEHPKNWTVCPSSDYGGCGGSGEVPLIGRCPSCKGAGYKI